MVILDIEQGSDEWLAARLGIPTASNFDAIITPTGKKSTQFAGYQNKLIAEQLAGKPLNNFKSEWMNRGNELEPEARMYYEFVKDVHVDEVGIVFNNKHHEIGASPDGLIGIDGGLEIKCPAPHTHVGYLLANKIPNEYIPQVQGNMMVTGRKWWDFMSYCPELAESGRESLIIRVPRDTEYIKNMRIYMKEFLSGLAEKKSKLI